MRCGRPGLDTELQDATPRPSVGCPACSGVALQLFYLLAIISSWVTTDSLTDRSICFQPPPSLYSAAFYVYIFAFDYAGYSDMSRANVLICRRVREQRHGLRQFWGVVWGWGGGVGYLSHWDPTPSL